VLRGAQVTLVSGPVSLETPRNVSRINVESAQEMFEAVQSHAKEADVIVMAAAVADFTPEHAAQSKIKKEASAPEIKLTKTVDILQSLGKKNNGSVLVGFALETDDEVRNATEKLKKKNLDMIVLNSLNDEGAGFGTETNVVTIIDKQGKQEKLPKMSKFDVAHAILDRVKKLM
jgi:phosphopantothenoylcysteine decarboxylase/phosphopantothenate--cysteine ligase